MSKTLNILVHKSLISKKFLKYKVADSHDTVNAQIISRAEKIRTGTI